MAVTNVAELNELVARVKKAQREYANFTQEQVDKIFRAAALAAADARIPLAKMAVEESGMGIVEDKVIKNHFASEYIYNAYKDEKTCGILSEDDTFGTITIAEPIGLICGIVPTTNPTSTAIFKALISLKTRNGIIFSPHPRAKNATNKAADIVLQAAIAAGAPKDIIGWIDQPTVELSNQLMHHPDINLILATGGPGMVKAAYSSGKPAIGVGAGNTPVVVDETADIKRVVASILMSKTFDSGVICASEQSVIVVDSIYDAVRERFASHGGYLLQGKELKAVQDIILKNGGLNAAIVGQSAPKIAEMAGIKVPANTKVLIGEVKLVDESEPFAHEKLSPTLAMYRAKDFEDAVAKAEKLVAMGGIGHTSCLYTDQDNQTARIAYFGDKMKTARILINTPASQGGIGDLYNFKLAPSLTLGCGSWGGNSISENVGPKHLINKKTVAKRAENMLWHKLPKSIYFRRGSLPIALEEVATDGAKRAFIRQSDRYLPLEGEAAPVGEPKKVWLNNRLRILIANALSTQRLVSADAAVRLQAATALQREAQGEQLPLLTRRLAQEKDPQVRDALSIALANLQLADARQQVRFNAVRLLGESGEPETRARLQALTDAANEPDAAVRAEAQRSLQRVQHRLMIGDLLGQAFSGLSLGSILLLAALGLAITYGLLGVINMAHGEMLMLGAYSAYLVQGLFQQFAPQWLALYPLAALPVAFAITAGIGMALERTVIRHLYGRPLETLLATWGISLILIQLVRVTFGAQNVEVANPYWLSGGVQLLPNLVLPYNRIVIIGFALFVVVLTWLLLNKTRLGLNVRAVTQNRNMAACCGVPTGRVDMLAFGLGSGIAGLGGVALSQIGNVGPSTCDAPSCPQVNPPSGNAPRIHSMTVHSPASPIAETTGRSGRHTAGARAPNAAAVVRQSLSVVRAIRLPPFRAAPQLSLLRSTLWSPNRPRLSINNSR